MSDRPDFVWVIGGRTVSANRTCPCASCLKPLGDRPTLFNFVWPLCEDCSSLPNHQRPWTSLPHRKDLP